MHIVNWGKSGIITNPVDIYLFKVKNGNTGTICEYYLKLTIKTSERYQ